MFLMAAVGPLRYHNPVGTGDRPNLKVTDTIRPCQMESVTADTYRSRERRRGQQARERTPS